MSSPTFHPIIESMIANANSKDRALALAQRKAEADEQADYRRKQLAEVVKRAQEEHDLNVQNLDLRKQQYDLSVKQFQHLAKHGVLEDIASGLQDPSTLPSAPTIPTALNSQPGNPDQTVTASPASVQPAPNFSMMPQAGSSDSQEGNVDVAGTSMPRAAVAQIPQNVARQRQQIAEAVAAPQIKREQMIEDARAARETANEAQRHQDAVDLRDMQQKFLEHQKDLDRQNKLDNTALIRAGMQHGIDPEDVRSLMEDATTGNADLSGSTKPVLAARTAIQAAGRKPFGAKDAAALKASVTLQEWIDKLRAFANTRPDNKVAAAAQGLMDNNPLIKTDAKTKYDEIQTGLINAGKALEGISGGRITIPQMKKLEEGATSLYTNKKNALDLADNLQNMLHTNVDTKILGGVPEIQRQLIFHAQGITPERLGLDGSPSTNTQLPDFLKIAPQKNKKGTPLNINESIKAGQPVYGGQ